MAVGSLSRKNTLSLLFSSLGMGFAVACYVFLNERWLGFYAPEGVSLTLLSGATSAALNFTAFLMLILLVFLCKKLGERRARGVVLAGGIGLSALHMAAVCCVVSFGLGLSAVVIMRGLFGALYAFMLCAWALSMAGRTVKSAITSVALGLVFAGATCLPHVLGQTPSSVWYGLVPFLAFASFFAARSAVLCGRQTAGAPKARPFVPVAPAPGKRRVSIISVYVVLMGFATTQFFAQNTPSNLNITSISMLVAAGILFLFISLSMMRHLRIKWLLCMCAVMFSVAIFFWFVLMEANPLIATTTGSLHWASFLLAATAGFDTSSHGTGNTASASCKLLGLFYVSTAIGTLTVSFGAVPRAVFGSVALALFLITFAVSYREQHAPYAERPAEEGRDRDEILQTLVRDNSLTPRETEVLCLLAEGNSLKHISETLYLSENTVKRYRTNLYQKMAVGSRQHLIDTMRAAGWYS